MHLLRVVLNSGSVTELMFDRKLAMSDACDVMRRTALAVSVPDDYGHEIYAEPNQIAALICVDLDPGTQRSVNADLRASDDAGSSGGTRL